jgi:hypothetical protein
MIWRSARPILALLLGTIAGILSAAVVLLWWRSPVPTFLVFTSVLHGMLIGVCLMWIVIQLNVHCPVRRTVIGLLAGVVSVAALLAGQYVSDAIDHQHRTRAALQRMMPQALPAARVDILSDYDHDVLAPVTGRTGMVGQFTLMTRGSAWRAWLRGIEAVLVIGIATGLCLRARAARPPAE